MTSLEEWTLACARSLEYSQARRAKAEQRARSLRLANLLLVLLLAVLALYLTVTN